MADWRLAGNGYPCQACDGLGVVPGFGGVHPTPWDCPTCGGIGRLPFPRDRIVEAMRENRTLPRQTACPRVAQFRLEDYRCDG